MKNVISQINPQILGSADRSVKLAIAESEQEKQRIYRLRYQVYAEEMGRRLESADHKNRLVFDEFDEWGYLLYAQVGTEVIGTVRLHMGAIENFSQDITRMFHMNIFQTFHKDEHKPKFGFSSKYVVASEYRRSQAAYLVIGLSYELCRNERGVQFSFAGCNPYMTPLYERMGFRRFADNVNVPEYGCMVPLVLMPEDASHLRAVGSPFYRDARKRQNDPAAANWFINEFPAAARFINNRLVSEDELWLILREKLGQSPLSAMPVLEGLKEEEAKKFVHIGVVHLYKKGESVFAPGDFCHEMNILLTGILEVSNPAINNPLDTTRVKPGDFCGRVALLGSGDQRVQATAVTEVELLIISAMAFEAFCHSHPVIALKVLRNIGRGADKGRLLSVNY